MAVTSGGDSWDGGEKGEECMSDVEVITGIGPIRRTRFDEAKQEWFAEVPLTPLCRMAQVNALLVETCQAALDYSTIPQVQFIQRHGPMTKRDLLDKLSAAIAKAEEARA